MMLVEWCPEERSYGTNTFLLGRMSNADAGLANSKR
jgi:hypothetical protein